MSDTSTTTLRSLSDLSIGERAQLFFKKAQYKNGKGMSAIDAENAARADMGVVALSDTEAAAASDKNIVQKVVDSKPLQAVGASALIHKEWDTVMGTTSNKEAEASSATDENTSSEEVAPAADTHEVASTNTKESTEEMPATSQSVTEQALGKIHSLEDTAKKKATTAAQGVVSAAAAKVGLKTTEIDIEGRKTEVFDRVPEEGASEK